MADAVSVSPTQLSLDYLRADGWLVEVVERWIPSARTRRDLFGFLDLVALRGDVTLGIQTTSRTNVSEHLRKIADAPALGTVREAGWTLHVHGWDWPDIGSRTVRDPAAIWHRHGGKGRPYRLKVVDVS